MPGPIPPDAAVRFEAVLFDWDGTAIATRHEDATALRQRIEQASHAALELAIVTGTSIETVDSQLRARPPGPGSLLIACNRGSECFRVDATGITRIATRVATPEEDALLDAATAATCARFEALGLTTRVVARRLNRRKIDLIPGPEWADPPKANIAALLTAVEDRLAASNVKTLADAVSIAQLCSAEIGLEDARITSDAKHIEIGLTDKGDAARFIGDRWHQAGVRSGNVLVIGDEFGPLGGVAGSDRHLFAVGARVTAISVGVEPEGTPHPVVAYPGGPSAFLALLDHQLAERARHALPQADLDPGWTIALSDDLPGGRAANEARATLANGMLGVRGAARHRDRSDIPAVLVADAYRGSGPDTDLMPAPEPGIGSTPAGVDGAAVLDLQIGTLIERDAEHHAVGVRFVLDHPGAIVTRDREIDAGPIVSEPMAATPEAAIFSDRASMTIETPTTSVTAIGSETVREGVTDRFVVVGRSPIASEVPDALRARGFDALFASHRDRMARRWLRSDVTCSNDAELTRAMRFGLFHLMNAGSDNHEAAVAARGLTGPAYRGHVFWDADVFVLPFLAATHPPAARAMLEYRAARLPSAQQAARTAGYQGARFPWESAATGVDVTPSSARTRAGTVIPIRTGLLEVHVVADIAWATQHYLEWSGDDAFGRTTARRILVETARYWASRVRRDPHGRTHIFGVIGPDEYHEAVDDNAFTNVMARENLRWAIAAVRADPGPDVNERECEVWASLADTMVDGLDSATGLYEQFAGFHDLDPIIIEEVAPHRPIAADLLLGADQVARAQVIKQADVLMLHHLVPSAVAPGSLAANLRHYEPRTAHGSSLSPGIHAALFARNGDPTRALDLLRLAARIDLDDITETTALGLHLGAMGSVWQAMVYGFLGCRPAPDALMIAPRIPRALGTVTAHVTFRTAAVTLAADTEVCAVTTDAPVRIRINDEPLDLGPGRHTWTLRHHRWERST